MYLLLNNINFLTFKSGFQLNIKNINILQKKTLNNI